jgi:hypothetical protein
MATSDIVKLHVISAVKNVAMAGIGAGVFIFGLIHATPLTTVAVEYVTIYGTYFGVHIATSNVSSGKLTTEPVVKK